MRLNIIIKLTELAKVVLVSWLIKSNTYINAHKSERESTTFSFDINQEYHDIPV